MEKVSAVVAGVLALHVLLKFVFFIAPYQRRRAALDKSYGNNLSATKIEDLIGLGLVIGVSIVLFVAGVQAPSFLIGLWCGATLIQIYFHEFHEPLDADKAPAQPAGPIKNMSYAIQASPWKPWREIVLLTVLVLGALLVLFV